MHKALLLRQRTSDEGTFGTLRVYKGGALLYSCFTGELPERENRQCKSCIPEGLYKVVPYSSKKYPEHYHVLQVKGRSGILIHQGNFCGDIEKGYLTNVQGCILVGRQIGSIQGQKAVLSSRLAMNDLRDILGKSPFTLEIRRAYDSGDNRRSTHGALGYGNHDLL